jgi:hypothetical protein
MYKTKKLNPAKKAEVVKLEINSEINLVNVKDGMELNSCKNNRNRSGSDDFTVIQKNNSGKIEIKKIQKYNIFVNSSLTKKFNNMKKIFHLIILLIIVSAGNLFAQGEQGKRVNIKTNEDFHNNSKFIVEEKTDLKYTNEEFFNKSDFIVEGKLINYIQSYDRLGDFYGSHNPEDIYTEYIFKVDYVYKSVDNLIKISDTIVIIADRGWRKRREIGPIFMNDTIFYVSDDFPDGYDGRYLEKDRKSVV